MKTKWDWQTGFSGLADMSQESLKNYFLYALPPGGFLTSVLCNHDVVTVFRRADHWNKPIIGKYIAWLDEYAPEGSWGSESAVKSWIAKGPAYQAFQKQLTMDILKDDVQAKEEPLF